MNIIRQFVKDVELKTKKRDVIAAGKVMAMHCDKRIARAKVGFEEIARACMEIVNHKPPAIRATTYRKALRAAARHARRYSKWMDQVTLEDAERDAQKPKRRRKVGK